MKIYTIGYEGRLLHEWISALQRRGVTLVVDIRRNPFSRKKGFSKHQLAAALEEAGISYRHLAALGNPAEIRAAFGRNGSKSFLYEQYTGYLESHPEAGEALLDAIEGEVPCLMCYELQPSQCHRGALTEYLLKKYKGIEVVHL